MADPIQRVNYFKNQFLHVEDFTTEQGYHVDMRRRHNRALHTYGIAEGLQLTFSANATAVTVRAGMGIDNTGRELVLVDDQAVELGDLDANREVFITIAYDETPTREQNETGVRGNTRIQELPKIERLLTRPAEGARLILGRVVRSGTQVQSVDSTVRSQAGAIEGDVLLTPRDPAVSADDYVSLRWTAAKQATLTGSLAIRKFAPATPDGILSVDGGLRIDAANQNAGWIGGAAALAFGAPGSGEGIFSRRAGAPNAGGLDLVTAGQPRLTIASNGRVGIGQQSPAQMLHVNGNAQVNNLFLGDVGHGPTWAALSHANAIGTTSYGLLMSSDGMNTYLGKKSGGGYFAFRVDNNDRVRVDDNGHLSVDWANANNGTISPGIAFGGSSGEAIASKRTGGAGTNQFGLDFYTQSQRRMSITNGGNVGIGTLNPSTKLEVAGDIRWANSQLSADQGGSIELGGPGSPATSVPYIDFHFGGLAQDYNARLMNDTDQRLSVYATTFRQNSLCLSGNAAWSSLSYNAHHNPANSDWVALDPNRRAVTVEMDDAGGVGRFDVWMTDAPGLGFKRRININGSTGVITFEGRLQVNAGKNAYVTDQFVNNLNDAIEQGDVVVLGDTPPPHYYGTDGQIPIPEVDLTGEAYDRRVCGIVDTAHGSVEDAKPKLFDGTETDLDQTRVAPGQIGGFVTLGTYAHCKVDADIAPIEIGDLLTTSPTRGHAQKVLDHDAALGAILGKALAPLDKGKGKIPILVTLH